MLCIKNLLKCNICITRYSFALEETGRFQDATAAAWESLSMNPQALWATHALGYVIDGVCDVCEGFLTSNRDHWKDRNHIAWHLYVCFVGMSLVVCIV